MSDVPLQTGTGATVGSLLVTKTRNFSWTVDLTKAYSLKLRYNHTVADGNSGWSVTDAGDGIQYEGPSGTFSASIHPTKDHQ